MHWPDSKILLMCPSQERPPFLYDHFIIAELFPGDNKLMIKLWTSCRTVKHVWIESWIKSESCINCKPVYSEHKICSVYRGFTVFVNIMYPDNSNARLLKNNWIDPFVTNGSTVSDQCVSRLESSWFLLCSKQEDWMTKTFDFCFFCMWSKVHLFVHISHIWKVQYRNF
jgi:hypothetical protein